MSETLQIIVGILALIVVYVLSQFVVGYRIRRAAAGVVKDLERRGALDPATAAELPYAKTNFLRIGLRDFRPKAVDALERSGIVGRTAAGRFYLKKRPEALKL